MILRLAFFLTFLTLASLPVMAQNNNSYDDSWKKVTDFMTRNLPQSAREEVKKIYSKATSENNQPQQIKALVYEAQLIQQVEENDWMKNIQLLTAEIRKVKEPANQILHSMVAQLYWNYFQNQRWRIYERTRTVGFKKDDSETWDATDFHQVIQAEFDSSLANPLLLQKTKLDYFEPVLTKGNQRRLRPTLYDLLVNEALDYYKTDEENITRPAYQFILADQASLAPANQFVKHTYTTKDSLSHEFRAIKLYQEWIRFHLNADIKDELAQLIDADISRIQYAYQHHVNENKDQLYKEALQHIYTQYSNVPEAMQAGYLLAVWWKAKGDRYVPNIGTQTDKYAIKEALRLAEEIVKTFPESEGAINAYNLATEIKTPTLSTQTEKVNTIQQPFRAMVQYKNINKLYLRLIAVTDKENDFFEGRTDYVSDDDQWKRLVNANPLTSWQQTLPSFDDFRDHSTEIKVNGLPVGKYLLLSSANPAFSLEKNPMAVSVLYVSNISFVNNNNKYFLLHRETGQPLAGATVQVYNTRYDYNTRKNVQNKAELLNANKNGYIEIDNDKSERNLKLEIRYNNDHLFLSDGLYNYRRYYRDKNKKEQTDWEIARYYLFTDRSIYRPGQKVYFKGIGVVPHAEGSKEKGNSLLLTNRDITAQLRDANYQVVDSLKLHANEYGSIHGYFMLPETGLTGNFTIDINIPQGSSVNFKVEEYKRPKFFVRADTVSGNYKLNDSIHVTGKAEAYAGNAIDGAIVKYRVYRQTRFLYPWLFWSRKIIWPPPGRNETMEITSGETTTNASGIYHITFKAIPDASVDKTLDPSFDYRIEVDVTDINGETRSTEQTVSVGYKSLLLEMKIPGGEQQDVDSLKYISINTTNLAGKHTPADVAVKIYSLQAPDRLIRERYWQQPDTAVMSYSEYVRFFPHDEYASEADPKSWKTNRLVFERQVMTTEAFTQIDLSAATWQPGWYVVETTTVDKDGNEVKNRSLFALNDYDKNLAAAPTYNQVKAFKTSFEPGEKAVLIQGTTANHIYAVQQIVKPGLNDVESTNFDFKNLNQTFTNLSFPVTEQDRGGYTVHLFFVKDNRVYSNTWTVVVPWTNKQLNISFETFRDKLLPGQQERWKVKISGYKADAVAAEMLASMYDASLDQFQPHQWQGLDIWPAYHSQSRWNAESNFTMGITSGKIWREKAKSFKKNYDKLIAVSQGYNRRIMLRGAASGVVLESQMAAAPPSSAQDISPGPASNKNAPVDENADKEIAECITEYPANNQEESAVHIRTNFNETAFFFPELHTNDKGEISFDFTVPEALTSWKLQTLAHTKDLSTALETRTIKTQKKLMVQPNAPRFLRQGDHLSLVTKVVNMSDEDLSGTVSLQMINSNTLQNVDALFSNKNSSSDFKVKAGQSVSVSFPISIPMNYTDAVSYRIVAQSANASDGEEMALPVLTNRMLVTESFPINLRNTNSKTFTWDKLLKSGQSSTLQNKSLTIEYSSNPVWYAVQALPYLMEYPYDCAEQTWNRFYANALAAHIANSMPKIKAVFDKWRNTGDSVALLSNLQKNEELKSVLLEETPWVLQAKTEAEQKKNIALLFDMVRMANESAKALNKIAELQSSNGGFSWFKGGPDDRYMTQYILSGIGHLNKLQAMPELQSNPLQQIIAKALPYLDARIKEDYEHLLKTKANLEEDQLSGTAIQYLYMRSFFTNSPVNDAKTAFDYYLNQAKKYWTKQGKYYQGMIALALFRNNDAATAKAILQSLQQNSISNEEFGMYWKEFNSGGFYWWQAPIESHALLIETFSEIGQDKAQVDDLKTWLLKQKQTNNWASTKATAEACYALLLQGNNWLQTESKANIQLGNITLSADKTEAGTGYFKEIIKGEDIKANMGNIKVVINKTSNKEVTTTSWGALYWQYFEDLDKISKAATPLSLQKDLFIIKNSDRGPVLTPVSNSNSIHVGDKIKVRIELRSDRNLEYVHLKDMRATCFEPVNVLSQYKYQDGLGYYEATKDASTNFFISYLNKGTYVFEYELIATNKGEFSNGISSIQCMYAPEFSSHSKGIRVTVE